MNNKKCSENIAWYRDEAQLCLTCNNLSRRISNVVRAIDDITDKLHKTRFEEDALRIQAISRRMARLITDQGNAVNAWGSYVIPNKAEHIGKLEVLWHELRELQAIMEEYRQAL